jgi:hypothetical protein
LMLGLHFHPSHHWMLHPCNQLIESSPS